MVLHWANVYVCILASGCRCELNVFPAWYFAQDALSIAKIQVKPHCHAEFS